jgi:hypothetical protein
MTGPGTNHNNMRFNVSIKTKEMRISFLRVPMEFDALSSSGLNIEIVQTFKLLGVIISSDLTWNAHVDYICTKASKLLFALKPVTDEQVLYDKFLCDKFYLASTRVYMRQILYDKFSYDKFYLLVFQPHTVTNQWCKWFDDNCLGDRRDVDDHEGCVLFS